MENNNKKITDKLEHLVAIAEDGERGYENAARDVEDYEMKNLFSRLSHERASYVRQLKAEILTYGEATEKEKGGPLGVAHRILMDLKSVFTSGDKNAIIKACLTGEDAAHKNYKEALDESYISGRSREILNEQFIGIQNAISSIKDHLSASTN